MPILTSLSPSSHSRTTSRVTRCMPFLWNGKRLVLEMMSHLVGQPMGTHNVFCQGIAKEMCVCEIREQCSKHCSSLSFMHSSLLAGVPASDRRHRRRTSGGRRMSRAFHR